MTLYGPMDHLSVILLSGQRGSPVEARMSAQKLFVLQPMDYGGLANVPHDTALTCVRKVCFSLCLLERFSVDCRK